MANQSTRSASAVPMEAQAAGHDVAALLLQDIQEQTDRSWPASSSSRRLPPLISLSYFGVAAKARSFAAAAKILHVTPAAVSHQIKALEEHLGVELFVRRYRKVSLTPAAQAALPRLLDGFEAIANAVDLLRDYSAQRSVITVCAEPLFATKWLVPRLHRFYARYPEAEIRLQASVSSIDSAKGGPTAAVNLRRAGIDLAIRLGYGGYVDLESKQLMLVLLVPVCSPGIGCQLPWPSARGVLKHPLLSDNSSQRSPERFGWAEWFRRMGLTQAGGQREQRFGNGLLALEAAVTGQGILLASRHIVHAELATGKLVVAYDQEWASPFAYYVVCPPPALDRPIVRAFHDWLSAEATTSA